MAWDPEEALGYYKQQGAPNDQSALVSFLRELQRESGGSIPRPALASVAEFYGVKETYLLAVIRRMPSLRLGDTHTLELCSGPSCGKRAALAALAEKAPKNVTVKFVPCMRMCGKGPNLRWDGKLLHQADEALLRRLFEEV